MTTKVIIENVEGPDIVLIQEGDRVVALQPGQKRELYVCFGTGFWVSEADIILEE